MEEQSVPRKYESVSKEDPIRVLMNSNSFRAVRFVAVTLATSSQPVPELGVLINPLQPTDTYLKRRYRSSARSGSSAIYSVFAKKKRKKKEKRGKNSGQVTRAATARIRCTSADYNNDVKAIRA